MAAAPTVTPLRRRLRWVAMGTAASTGYIAACLAVWGPSFKSRAYDVLFLPGRELRPVHALAFAVIAVIEGFAIARRADRLFRAGMLLTGYLFLVWALAFAGVMIAGNATGPLAPAFCLMIAGTAFWMATAPPRVPGDT